MKTIHQLCLRELNFFNNLTSFAAYLKTTQKSKLCAEVEFLLLFSSKAILFLVVWFLFFDQEYVLQIGSIHQNASSLIYAQMRLSTKSRPVVLHSWLLKIEDKDNCQMAVYSNIETNIVIKVSFCTFCLKQHDWACTVPMKARFNQFITGIGMRLLNNLIFILIIVC